MQGSVIVLFSPGLCLVYTQGIGYRNQTRWVGFDNLSMMGGVPIYIQTTGGLDMNAALNTIAVTSKNIPQAQFIQPRISDDDAFNSNTAAGKLGWTIPSVMDIFSTPQKQYTYYDFNNLPTGLPGAFTSTTGGTDYIVFDISVASMEFAPPCYTHWTSCHISYNQRFTPYLFDTVPNQVYAGLKIAFMLNPVQIFTKLPSDWEPFYYLKIGQELTNWEGLIDVKTRFANNMIGSVNTIVGNNKPSKSQDPDINFSMFGRTFIRNSAKHCNWSGKDCWTIRIHPKIDSISASTGFLDGGQLLQINGFGLSGQAITVNIDGIPCSVIAQQSTDTAVVCQTGPKTTPSTTNTSQPGAYGATHSYVKPSNPKTYVDWNTIRDGTYPPVISLSTTLELQKGAYASISGDVWDGWFLAPTTGNYKFYFSAGSQCKFFMDATKPYDPKNPQTINLYTTANTVGYSWFSIDYRQYERIPYAQGDPWGFHQSNWISLTGGKYYKFQAQHINWGGDNWMSMAVEFQNPNPNGHPLTTKAVQNLQIQQTPSVSEQWTLTVNNPGSGQYSLQLQSPLKSTKWTSAAINCNETGGNFGGKIAAFFQDCGTICGNMQTDLAMYDSTGAVTSDATKAKKYVYTITLMKRITGFSFTSFAILPYGSISSVITVMPPYGAGGIASSKPLGGYFVIKCPDPNGNLFQTRPQGFNRVVQDIQADFEEDIGWLRGRVRITDNPVGNLANNFQFNYRANGVNLNLIFDGLNSNPPQCSIASDTTNPITGDSPSYINTVIRPFGEGIMFEPIGLEFLYSNAMSPQVLVNIDEIPAVCPNLNCDYAYVASTSQITAQTFNTATNVLTITGTLLPTIGVTVSLGGASCNLSPPPTYTATQIQCTLANQPRAGSHKTELRTSQGLLPYASGVTDIIIPLVVTSVSPTTVNPLGGAILTIIGSGFPTDLSLISVTFSDQTLCNLQSSTYTQIICQVAGFSNLDGNSRKIIVTVQNIRYISRRRELQTVVPSTDQSLSLSVNTSIPKVTSIDKTNVSPVLKQTLTFQLNSDYADTLVASDLVVTILNNSKNYSRSLYVMSVDNTSKKFIVKFNGAPMGNYTFQVISNSASQYGLLDTSALTIITSSTVTQVSPLQGSVLGGTILTITGTNFSTTISDQAVKVGDYYCDILSATTTQLICQIRQTGLDVSATSQNNLVLVILAASSEADCPGNNCNFTFAAPVATISSLSPSFNSATNSIEITATGTGFPTGTTTGIQLKLNGQAQTTNSVNSSTSLIFKVSNVSDTVISSFTVFFADGFPSGLDLIQLFTLTPSFVSISPNSLGSVGGTLLTVSVPGIGIQTKGLNLYDTTSSQNLCKIVTVTGYGIFTCLTYSLTVASTDTIVLMLGTTQLSCANTDKKQCQFSQVPASSPTVTAASISTNIITFTGILFPDATLFTALANFKSQQVQLTGWTSTSATATFTNGIPAALQSENTVPQLMFTRNSDNVIFIAYSIGVTLANTVTVAASDSSTGVSVSFAGGLSYTITKNNIYATLLETGNSIAVCGNVCPIDKTQSDITKAVCKLPSLATTYSAMTYSIVQSAVISGTWTGSVQSQVQNVLDGIYPSEFTDPNANCYIQLSLPDSQVGVLNSAKILFNNLPNDKTPYVGNLKLQGFDGTKYTDIWVIDTTIHEGWNTMTWAAGSLPAYQKYQWIGKTIGSCRIGEIVFNGIVAYQDTSTSTVCTPQLIVGSTSTALSPVTYSTSKTPTITSITPRYGNVVGNEQLLIAGTNFISGSTTVTIDGIVCKIVSVTTSQIQCTTGQRLGDQPNPTFIVSVDNSGLAVNQGNTFTYVQYWSATSTWRNDAPPQFGEGVEIPAGRNLLVDVDTVPQLSFILIHGSLIFAPHSDPNRLRTFDAGYIFIQGGYMEVGTETFPYTSKITITMHGDVYSPALPTYGNKNIAVRNGMLSMVGNVRKVIWTMLDKTANANEKQITLMSQKASDFDWQIGEQIVIASTSFDKDQAEVRTITAVGTSPSDSTKPLLTLDLPLLYKHYAATETYGTSDFIDMRAEVGLLTRNVKYRGDPETSAKNKYGAHIMLHSPGDESSVGRILYCELTDVGQAYKLGRYPIHFHLIGTVAKSLVKGNSIHQTYNRAVTIHAVSYFNVVQNVIYNTMGHSIFIEDAIETKNVIDGNLVIGTNRSWSLLNSDQTPASFWITNPDNVIINNRAAGSDRYGFWYDLKPNPMGPSFTTTICPENMRLGEFRDNVAHSNGRYGLRIFHKMIPRTNPCDPLVFDNSNPSAVGAPYPKNPVVPALFYNFVAWKNVENGAIAEQTGAVQFINFKVADHMMVGIEWSVPDSSIQSDGLTMINGALVIGRSLNTEAALDAKSPVGIITPRKEYFTVKNVKFYSFNFQNGSSAFSDCSHCFFADSTDSGARTITVSGLYFDSTITKKVSYQMPWRGIYLDADGSLTGLGAGSWAIADFPHNQQPECTTNLAVYSGQICDNTVQVRRIVFWDPNPQTMMGMNMRIAKYDDSVMQAKSAADLKTYQKDLNNYSTAYQTILQDPQASWALPYVTGHKYRIFWDIGQLDILNMKMEISSRWQPTDKPVLFNLPYVDPREDIDFFGKYSANYATDGKSSLYYPSGSLTTTAAKDWLTGYNYNDNLNLQELNFVVTGNVLSKKTIQINGIRCRENLVPWCNQNPVVSACTGTAKLWSDPATWVTSSKPAGGVPSEGDNVIIPSGANIIFDLATSPIYKLVTVDGCLSFLTDNSKNQEFKANQIYVHTGQFTIGSSTAPYTKKAIITLFGDFDSTVTVMDGATEAGNKLIANNGIIGFYGVIRSRMCRLKAEALKGSTTVSVDTGLDWVSGDLLGFPATAMNWQESETATVQSYNSATGALVLTKALQFYHFGAAQSTGTNYQGLDMRGEVILLTRNILIQGDATQNNWGGQFVTSDATQFDSTGKSITLSGLTTLNNVEFFNMGQLNTDKAALRFENSNRSATGTLSTVTNSVVHDSYAWAIKVKQSSNINMSNCDVFTAKQVAVVVDIVTNVKMDSVNVYNVIQRIANNPDVADKECCVAFCSWSQYVPCKTSSWTNSIIAGCPFAGIIGFGYSCKDPVGGSTSNVIKNVVIHSVNGSGASILPDPSLSDSYACYQISHITAYKNTQGGIGTMYPTMDLKASNILLVDNQLGITLNTVQETDDQKLIELSNSFIYGENSDLANDCPDGATGTTGANCYCVDKYGLMNFYSLQKGKDAHIEEKAARPVYNTKASAVWNPKAVLNNITFINFKTTTRCGSRQSAIGLNPLAPDYIPVHYFTNTIFTNVENDAIAYLRDPPLEWASINDCGLWPCTGPSNSIFNFYNSVFQVTDGKTAYPTFWKTASTKSYNFQIVGKVQTAGQYYPNCTLNSRMNAFFCADPQQTLPLQVGILEFESLDGDTLTRSVEPIIITSANGYSNTLNKFMDHGWDGFYTSQKRLGRFIAQVQTGQAYTVTYTGTPPKSMRYILRSDTGTSGITVKVFYPNAGAYSVSVAGSIIPPNSWDAKSHAPATIDPATAICGTNRFVGVVNYIEFYLTPNCIVVINPRDAILTSVRLQWTSAEFFNGDGVTTFCQRMASVLGIDASRVKIVSVYEGSLNIDVQVLSDPTTIVTNADGSVQQSTVALADLTTLTSTLMAAVQPGSTALGAPVLQIQIVQQTTAVVNTIAVGTIIQPGAAISSISFSISAFLAILSTFLF